MTDEKDNKHRLTRRDTLKGLAAGAAAGVVGASLPVVAQAGEPGARPPNVIVILSDNHRWDHLSCVGHPFLKTPAMDRLAREGVLMQNAFVTTSLCSPSRACFLTGTYAHTHGIKNNLTPWTGQRTIFLELLSKAGYDTGFIGKWHMPGEGLPKLPFLDRFVSFTIQGGQGRYFWCPLIVDGVETASRKEYVAEELTDYAIEFLRKDRKQPDGSERPFALYLSHKSVHHPYKPPNDLAGIYKDIEIEMPEGYDAWLSMTNGRIFSGTMGLLPDHWRNYCEAIVGMDREIGRLLDTLDTLGLADDTVVIYTSDNGMMWGEHRKIDMNWPYEESIRIPMIARMPGRFPAGQRAGALALNVDLAPTILELANVSVPSEMEGKSMLPLWANPSAAGRESFMFEYFKDYPYNIPTYHGIRTRTHKYVEYDGAMDYLLFDLQKDAKELDNLWNNPAAKDLQSRLVADLKALKKQYGVQTAR